MKPTVRRQKSRGQAVVEFALILPVFLLLTLGVVDMARLFTAYIALTNGVSNAALYAAQDAGYGRWCPALSVIGCPAGGPGTVDNPNNIAYQIEVETTGLDQGLIVFSPPLCTPSGGGADVLCGNVTEGTYKTVKIAASYQVSMLTPLMNVLLGGPVQMSAATTAATY